MPDILRGLTATIGTPATAFVAGVDHPKTIERRVESERSPGDAERRLRFTYQIVMTLMIADSPAVVQAWLMGVNPELEDQVPLRLLKEGNLDQVAGPIVGAERTFASG